MLVINILKVGQLQSNCYLCTCSDSKQTMIIDPGGDGEFIIHQIHKLQVMPMMIVATHGHFDHVGASLELKLAFNIPFYIHGKDADILKQSHLSAHHWLGIKSDPAAPVDDYFKDQQIIRIGKNQFQIVHTPGHTPGGVCLYFARDQVLFSGDTLFAQGGVGRTDFSYSSSKDLKISVNKLLKLDSQVKIYSGHGPPSMIKDERRHH